MVKSIVVTLSGPDRPGLVRLVSECATHHGANWADAVMANFAGQFCGIVHLQVSNDRATELVSALNSLSGDTLTIDATVVDAASRVSGQRMTLDLIGNDRPGIIQSISGKLSHLGVNIGKLTTHITSAPMSGENLFSLHAEVVLPVGFEVGALQSELESLANELMVDLSLHDA